MADSEKTATHSHQPSILEHKSVVEGVVETAMPSTAGSANVPDPIIADEKSVPVEGTSKRNSQVSASASEEEDKDFEYPKGWKLGAITIALCLSVFCMALVSPVYPQSRF
jgi:hypothetical protein